MQRHATALLLGVLGILGVLGAGASAAAEPPLPPPRLGVQIQRMTPALREHMKAPSDRGVLVVGVEEASPAARAGIEVGDVILSVGPDAVREPRELVYFVARAPGDQPLAIEVVRDGERKLLEARPEGPAAPPVTPEEWEEWIDDGMRIGRQELRDWLRELERRIDELERELEKQQLPDDAQRT
jgi:membrane-associated protease RseP (regulator of RpoE activity)